jgi:transcriptional regulator with XRE-family HTH domain
VAQSFDPAAFYAAIDRARADRSLSWRQVGRELGLSASTFSRLAKGRRPDVDTFLKLVAWLDVPVEAFLTRAVTAKSGRSRDDALPAIAAALRRDPSLDPRDVDPIEDIVRVAYNRFRKATRRAL